MSCNIQNTSITVTFICQPGELEIKSLLLAFSLRENLKIDYCPVVLIPEYFREKINPTTILLFGKLGIDIKYFNNTLADFKKTIMPGEAMSNKFFGISVLCDKNDFLFLDSDIACLNSLPEEICIDKIAAKPADYHLKTDWKKIYQLAGVSYPETMLKSTVDQIESPPYFNTGVLFIPKNLKSHFCNLWKDYFVLLSDKKIISKKLFDPFHRDQIAFALATEKLKLKVKSLSEPYNYPARTRKTISPDTFFAHYHDCYTLASKQTLFELYQRFLIQYPEFKTVLNNQLKWRLLANHKFALLNQVKITQRILKKTKMVIRNFR